MWPFKKKQQLPGFQRTVKGDLTFDITEEEQQEIDILFDMLKDHRVHPDAADTLTRGITARGLANFAENQIMWAGFDSQKDNRDKLINKAIASIGKAYSIYPLPIYLYDLACCLYMTANGHKRAANTFKLFLERQGEYKPGPLDDVFMRDRDIDEARKDAVQKLRGMP
jgi:hypothetical protein